MPTCPAGQPGCYGIERRHGGKGPGATLSVLVVDPNAWGCRSCCFSVDAGSPIEPRMSAWGYSRTFRTLFHHVCNTAVNRHSAPSVGYTRSAISTAPPHSLTRLPRPSRIRRERIHIRIRMPDQRHSLPDRLCPRPEDRDTPAEKPCPFPATIFQDQAGRRVRRGARAGRGGNGSGWAGRWRCRRQRQGHRRRSWPPTRSDSRSAADQRCRDCRATRLPLIHRLHL